MYEERGWFNIIFQFDWWRYPESMMDKNRVFAMTRWRVFVGEKCLSDIKISPLHLLVEYLKKSQRRAEGEYASTVIPTSALLKIATNTRVA